MTTIEHWQATADSLRPRTDLLIGGEWVGSRSGKRFATINPATGSAIADIA